MLLNTLYFFGILSCLVYIESQTFAIERLMAILFTEKDIPVETIPEFVSRSVDNDTEEMETKVKMEEEMRFMKEYIFNHVKQGEIAEVVLEDDDYVPLTPSEVSA